MISLFFSFLAAFIFVSTLIFLMRPLALEFGLVDRPCARKTHKGEVPLVGGLAIYVGLTICSFILTPFDVNYRIFLLSTSFMVLIGALDDFHDINAQIRLIAQLLIASLMVFGANLYISDLGHLFSTTNSVELGVFGPIFTVLAVIACINAFNMIDGLDGLVGVLSLTTFSGIAALAVINGIHIQMQFMSLLIGAILAFLFFNVGMFKNGKYKVFMGDAGSMLIGLTIIWLLTFLTQGDGSVIRPVTALWLIAVPLMDMLSVITRRLLRGHSPMRASRDHIHHVLLNKFKSNFQTVMCIGVLSVFCSAIGVMGEVLVIEERLMLGAFLIFFVVFHVSMARVEQRNCLENH